MALTCSFRERAKAKIKSDPKFQAALFSEAVQALLAGDPDAANAALRAYINATIGFERLAKATGNSPKSLMRVFGPHGNPTAANLSGVFGTLRKKNRRAS